ncbi:hypothetical protein [Glycomyces tenuis]|uniref:hypothetical protein n=1 Tax=Glycomyces tenuis TaxID=58116 RepID=UPI00040EA50B|nr:hypothetical protein [Glycomyces tenuis]
MSGRDYDLREDARSLIAGQWLRDGERLRTFAPTGRGNYRSEIRGYPSFAWRALTVAGWSALKLVSPVGIVTGGVPYWNEIRRFEGEPPPVVAFGEGRRCRAAEVLGSGPHRSGVWALSHERFGFAADKRQGEPHPKALKRAGDTFVVLENVIDVPSTEFDFEGQVERGSRGTVYLRIRFHDGSGVDVRGRRSE